MLVLALILVFVLIPTVKISGVSHTEVRFVLS